MWFMHGPLVHRGQALTRSEIAQSHLSLPHAGDHTDTCAERVLEIEVNRRESGVLGSLSQATRNLVMREALGNLEDIVWLFCCLLDRHEVRAS